MIGLTDRCRSGPQCSGKTSDGPAVTVSPLCAACIHDIQKCLEELPHLSVALRTFLGGSTKIVYESKVRATHEPQAPMDVRVADLLDEIDDAIDRADGLRVADLIRQPAMKFILWIKGKPTPHYLDGADRALSIRRVHGKANAVIGFERVWQRRHALCPQCGLPTLGNWVGDGVVQCSDCGLVMALDEYDAYCTEILKG